MLMLPFTYCLIGDGCHISTETYLQLSVIKLPLLPMPVVSEQLRIVEGTYLYKYSYITPWSSVMQGYHTLVFCVNKYTT